MAYTYPANLYQGWDPASAQADYNATGGVGKAGYDGGGSGGGSFSADDYINNAINSISGMFKKLKPYDEVNPFSFDEALAKEASTAEYTPYYQELLTDYTTKAERNLSRSEEDKKRTIDQLAAGKEYYTGVQRRLLDKTINNTNKGYAGNGLYFSGAREKDVKDYQTEFGAQMGNYENQYQYSVNSANLANKRTQEDTTLAQNMYNRDTERAKQTAITGGILQRKNEALQQYEAGRTKYYQQQYA